MSPRSKTSKVVRITVCLLPWVVGCAGGRHEPASFDSLPVLSLAPDELVARIAQEGTAVTALKGKVELGMRVPPEDAFKRCRGVIAARSPWAGGRGAGLYLEGYRQVIPTLFTLVSDGREFWLHVPYDNTAYNGPLGGPPPVRHGREIHLDVLDLYRALFVQPIAPGDSIEVTEQGADYVVSVASDGVLQRRLWIERRTFTVPREVHFGPHGDVRLQIDREAYAEVAGKPYPMRLVLRDLASNGTVLLEFGSVTLEPEKLDDRIFIPKLPAGTIVRRTDIREAKR